MKSSHGSVHTLFYAVLRVCLLALCAVMTACSTTTSSVRDLMAEVDRSELKYIRIAVIGREVLTSSQDSGRLYELHSRSGEVLTIARNVASAYGFTLVDEDQADFVLDIEGAVPDGGACVHGVEYARDMFTYSASLITFGIVPAKAAHCMVVTGMLYEGYVDEGTIIGEFVSNRGWVRIYAGIGELPDYRKTVTERDEIKALEASLGGLMNLLIEEGAFK